MELLANFPCLLTQDLEGLHFDGYIPVCGQFYRLEIKLPAPDRLCDAAVNCDWKLQAVMANFKDVVHQRLQQCDSLVSFVRELQMIAERQLESGTGENLDSAKFCRKLIEQVESLGWNRVAFMNETFTELQLQCTDSGQRRHIIKLYIGSMYPEEAPKYSVELPTKFDLHWTKESTLIDAYEQWKRVIDSYQEFWDLLSEIDAGTWVLEPEKPTFGSRHRRMAISTGVSVQVTVDPGHPRALPECKFLGSDQAITQVRENMNSNIHLWTEGESLLKNLESLLDVKFPSPTNTKKEEFSVECGICYAYRMEAEIPDEVCNDTRCGQAFHKTCLVEWLRALPSSRQSFSTIFGNCPYCEKAMTVKMIVK